MGGQVVLTNPVSLTYLALSDLLAQVRLYLNDAGLSAATGLAAPQLWSDARLIPFSNPAYRRLQRDLAKSGVKNAAAEAIITLKAGGTAIQLNGQPPNVALPLDFLYPWELWERPSGGTWQQFTPMVMRRNGLSKRGQTSQLGEWEDIGDALSTLGATQDREILLRYERALPPLVSQSNQLGIRDSLDAISHAMCSRIGRSRGVVEFARDHEAWYQDEKDLLVTLFNRPKQRWTARRRPYSARRRAYYR